MTWDSYRAGNYDIFVRRIGSDGATGPEMQVTTSRLFQAHPTIAIDEESRVWLAWDEANTNWGKDWTHDDPNRGTVLYESRRPKVAVLMGTEWRQPATDVISAVPARYRRYVQYPRIAAGGNGRIWLGLQLRTGTAHNRSDYWASDGRWEHYLTMLEGDSWSPLMPVPQSSCRPEGPLMVLGAPEGARLIWTYDNRPLSAPAFFEAIPNKYEIFSAAIGAARPAGQPKLEPFADTVINTALVHPSENKDVARIRAYRSSFGGQALRILRGDFHRHTEISTDGAGDGSIEDYFRYMLDAAAMDTGIVSDHNAGNDDEYSWWRTEKAIDLFLIPNRYTPMFGYERSPGYPNGHRNVVFAERGVRTLPMPMDEMKGATPSGPILYPYLKKNNGIGMVHSSATSQGTDWRDNDPEVEPLLEIYQGYHTSYEYEGAPRAESRNLRVSVHGRYEPAGFWWNALAKGYKLGVQASSDHISTHTSYTMIYSPSPSRRDILESMRSRHAYAATDNILIDYQAEADDGRTYMMGDALRAKAAPNLRLNIFGTDSISDIYIIKDQKVIYHQEPGQQNVEFSFRDTSPGSAQSYYYLRVHQRDRNLACRAPFGWTTDSCPKRRNVKSTTTASEIVNRPTLRRVAQLEPNSMTRSLPRRTFLAALGVSPLAAASSTWERRRFPEWTRQEIDRLLTDSPWAKSMTMAFELQPPPPKLLSDFSDVRLPGGMGLPSGIPGIGWPGAGGQTPGRPGGGTSPTTGGGRSTVRTEAYLTIRWSSALPVRQAVAIDRWGRDGVDSPEARAFLEREEPDYVVEVFGLPTIVVHQKVKQLGEELQASAGLLPKAGRVLRASSVDIPEHGQYLAVTFRFPRTTPISVEQENVEFTATTPQFDLRKKFKLEAMFYGGRLEL